MFVLDNRGEGEKLERLDETISEIDRFLAYKPEDLMRLIRHAMDALLICGTGETLLDLVEHDIGTAAYMIRHSRWEEQHGGNDESFDDFDRTRRVRPHTPGWAPRGLTDARIARTPSRSSR